MSIALARDFLARDLEALLNTRSGLAELYEVGSFIRSSIVGFGVPDFSNKPLENPLSSSDICRCIEDAIRFFEPRLKGVSVSFSGDGGVGQRLHFVIKAVLVLNTVQESVNFDALIQPHTLKCSVNAAGHRGSPSLLESLE